MTNTAGMASINCTSCGAGLSVLGGGRVLSHVCGYCGAVLDTQDNYKVLDTIGKRNHPDSPVQIGQTLTLEGVEFTVIGTLGITERHGGQSWKWVEHQVFSPTHGYLWLNVEEGQLTYTRKVRDFNMGHWLSSSTVERSEVPPSRSYSGQTYRYYDSSVTQIDFMEGEFNWVPKLGEKKTVVNLLGPDTMLSLVKSQTEREVEVTRLLPRAETAAELGFAESALGAVGDVHPLTPHQPLPEESLLRKVLVAVAVIAALLGVMFWSSTGREVFASVATPLPALPQTFEFEIENTAQLARLTFATDLNNQWTSFGTDVRSPSGEVVLSAERTISYYTGGSTSSRDSSILFRAPETGTYTASLAVTGGSSTSVGNVALQISQGKPTGFWAFALAILAGLGWLLLAGRQAMHSKRRFSGTDWND